MISPPQFEIASELLEGTARLSVSGELDLATVPRLRQEAQALLARNAQHILIDLNELTFIDSSGLSLFIELNDRSRTEGWTLSITRPSKKAFSIFTITGADRNLPFTDNPHSP